MKREYRFTGLQLGVLVACCLVAGGNAALFVVSFARSELDPTAPGVAAAGMALAIAGLLRAARPTGARRGSA